MDNPNEIENDENKNLIDDREEATVGMDEIENFDFERAVMLMSVIEKCATVGVKATSISGLAQASLNEMNEEAKVLAKKRAEAFKELERKRDEALAAQRREREELDAANAEEAERMRMHPKEPVAPSTPRAIPSNRAAPAPAPTERRV